MHPSILCNLGGMSQPAYEREPYRQEFVSTLQRTGTEKNRPFAVLADTIFYPEGGGQPADRGAINGIAVTDVQKREGEIRHYLAAPLEAGVAELKLDWNRRFDHMQQHTGQHLLTAVAQDRFSLATTAFHLGESTCDIEVDSASVDLGVMEELEEAVAAEIRAARPVSIRYVKPEEMESAHVRTRGLPEGFTGDVRLVEIRGIDINTCGGTHLSSTSEIEMVKLLGKESIRGGTRLFFVAGGRARRRLSAHEVRNSELRSLLGVADADFAGTVRGRLEEIRQLSRSVRSLEEELIALRVESLLSSPNLLQISEFEQRDGAFLQKLGRSYSERAPEDRVLFATSVAEDSVFFVLALGKGSKREGTRLVKEVAPLLGGRGGGSGLVFQGKGILASGVEQARKLLADLLGSAG